MRLPLLLGLLVSAAFVLSACGEDEAPKGGGSDEDYLRTICASTREFSNALVSKTSADEIAEVIRDFIDKMKDTNPPADLVKYNDDFVDYLEEAVNEPTSLVTRKPPLPSKDVQRRLATKELTVEECKDGTFFSRDLEE